MGVRFDGVASTARAVLREARSENIKFMAGSIAYHAFVSLLPVLLLSALVVSTVGGDSLAGRVVADVTAYFPATVERFVARAVASGRSGHASILSAVVLLWGTFKIFRALDAAFAELYDTERRGSLRQDLRETVVVLVAVVLSIVALGVTGVAFGLPAWMPFQRGVNELASVLVLGVAFLPLYYVLPNVSVGLREVVPGVAVAAVGWKLLQGFFHLYAAVSASPDAYGVAGTVILVIVWLYFGSFVLRLGASVNAVLAGRDGDDAPESAAGGRDSPAVASREQFEAELDRLVGEARSNDVPAAWLRESLRRRSDAVDDAVADRR